MRKSVPLETAYHLINHGAVPVLTSGDGSRRNLAPINWTMPICDDPFLVATAVEEGIWTEELIRATGEFAINVLGEPFAARILAAGRSSGRDGDKFDRLGFQAVPCEKIKPPRIAEAPIHLECRVRDRHPYPGISLFVAEVLYAEAAEAVFDGHRLILENLKTLHHISGGVFAVTDRAFTIPR